MPNTCPPPPIYCACLSCVRRWIVVFSSVSLSLLDPVWITVFVLAADLSFLCWTFCFCLIDLESCLVPRPPVTDCRLSHWCIVCHLNETQAYTHKPLGFEMRQNVRVSVLLPILHSWSPLTGLSFSFRFSVLSSQQSRGELELKKKECYAAQIGFCIRQAEKKTTTTKVWERERDTRRYSSIKKGIQRGKVVPVCKCVIK